MRYVQNIFSMCLVLISAY